MKVTFTTDGTKRNRFFESLCLKTQSQMKKFLKRELNKRGRDFEDGDGYIYTPGTKPVLLVAHMDTVHEKIATEIVYKDGTISSPQGIGGDDRCGIYMILRIIKDHDCHVLFCEDEECGGVGSHKFINTETCKNLTGKIQYAIELDRMNAKDAVYYDLDNPEFEYFIEKEFWKGSYGSYTDICTICPVIECAGVNLSCGYYKQHTKMEYVDLNQMETSINEVCKLLNRTTETDSFEYIERKHYYGKSYYGLLSQKYNSWDDDDDYGYNYGYYYGKGVSATTAVKEEKTYEIGWVEGTEEYCTEEVGISEVEALGYFMINNPDVKYADVRYVVCID